MGYKSKKINRRRFFKRQSKKKMYGGEVEVVEEKQEVPTLSSNVSDAGKLALSAATNATASGINSLGESLGINTEESPQEIIEDLQDKTDVVVDAIKSPEGQELVEDLGEIGQEAVKALEPGVKEMATAVQEGIKDSIPIATNMAKDAIKMMPVVGELYLLGDEATNVGLAVGKATETAAKLTESGAETLQKLEAPKNKFWQIVDSGKNLLSKISSSVNSKAKDLIDYSQQKVDSVGNKIVEESHKTISNPPIAVQSAGGSLKKIKKDSIMLGGRINQSRLEFLSPHVNSSQIMKQYGGK
jgi:hypothetical protein